MSNKFLNTDVSAVVVVWLNLAGAVAATVVAVIAARVAPRYRAALVGTALLAALYSVGYGWLIFVDIHPADWSRSLRWLGIVAWPLVWVYPSLRLIRRTTALRVAEERHGAD